MAASVRFLNFQCISTICNIKSQGETTPLYILDRSHHCSCSIGISAKAFISQRILDFFNHSHTALMPSSQPGVHLQPSCGPIVHSLLSLPLHVSSSLQSGMYSSSVQSSWHGQPGGLIHQPSTPSQDEHFVSEGSGGHSFSGFGRFIGGGGKPGGGGGIGVMGMPPLPLIDN